MLDQYDPDRDPLTDSDIWSGYHGNSTQQADRFVALKPQFSTQTDTHGGP